MLLQERGPQSDDSLAAETDDFAANVFAGLSKPQKSLPSRFFYDARGSELFEEITRLPEYYLTRAEIAILRSHSAEIVSGVSEEGVIVEFGSGSSLKTEILLSHLRRLKTYVPIDVSQTALNEAKVRLAARFPLLGVCPILADFSKLQALPPDIAHRHKTGFFPGSTIGNFEPAEAIRLLRHFRTLLSPEGGLIIGVDLKKDAETLVHAYDDPAGVTAAFNLNLLARINRELGGAFDLSAFRHKALYNAGEARIEMHLESARDQEVRLCGHRFGFRAGETIHTENAYKFSIDGFRDLAREAGWMPQRVWTDADGLFIVHELASLA